MDFHVRFNDLNDYQREKVVRLLWLLQSYCDTELDLSVKASYKEVMLNILDQTQDYLDCIVKDQDIFLFGPEFIWLKDVRSRVENIIT